MPRVLLLRRTRNQSYIHTRKEATLCRNRHLSVLHAARKPLENLQHISQAHNATHSNGVSTDQHVHNLTQRPSGHAALYTSLSSQQNRTNRCKASSTACSFRSKGPTHDATSVLNGLTHNQGQQFSFASPSNRSMQLRDASAGTSKVCELQ